MQQLHHVPMCRQELFVRDAANAAARSLAGEDDLQTLSSLEIKVWRHFASWSKPALSKRVQCTALPPGAIVWMDLRPGLDCQCRTRARSEYKWWPRLEEWSFSDYHRHEIADLQHVRHLKRLQLHARKIAQVIWLWL